jgi:hypothetical protein
MLLLEQTYFVAVAMNLLAVCADMLSTYVG